MGVLGMVVVVVLVVGIALLAIAGSAFDDDYPGF